MNLQNILIIILAIASVVYSMKNKQELTLDGIISTLIIQAKNEFLTTETEKKFDYVLAETKKKIPFPLNILVSESKIKEMTNQIYKDRFKEDFWNTENKQIAIIETVEKLVKSTTKPMNILTKVTEMKNEVKEKGYIEGFVQTGIKKGIEAGIKFGKKF